jgi:16S rRNA (uracil1498-N3)-methyltransferase
MSSIIRLFTEKQLNQGSNLILSDKNQLHYLLSVMRVKVAEQIKLFNGQDGEWLAEIVSVAKNSIDLAVHTQLRKQQNSSDVWLIFAPIKNNKNSFIIEKSTELGVSKILPMLTSFTVVKDLNIDKMRLVAIEAAEQCERLDVPCLDEITTLAKLVKSFPSDRKIILCDERGRAAAINSFFPKLSCEEKYAIMIGPEGGFAPNELEMLRALPFVLPISLGPRILRAETAIITALSCFQAYLGDFKQTERNISVDR